MGEGKDVSGTDRDEPAGQHWPGGVRRRDNQTLSRQVAGQGRELNAAEMDDTLGGVRVMIGPGGMVVGRAAIVGPMDRLAGAGSALGH